jgi:15-cis-phytoene synthase
LDGSYREEVITPYKILVNICDSANNPASASISANLDVNAGMPIDLTDELPPLSRLALAYAPARSRPATLALLALDRRLGAIVSATREPMLGQIKLAWWRDRLGEDPERWPVGEPVLAALGSWGEQAGRLTVLVDGWEAILADEAKAEALAEARGHAWAALAGLAGCPQAEAEARRAAFNWSLVDLALSHPVHSPPEPALAAAKRQDWRPPRLPRVLRPLAILHGLARRAIVRNHASLIAGPAEMAVVVRIGLFGR